MELLLLRFIKFLLRDGFTAHNAVTEGRSVYAEFETIPQSAIRPQHDSSRPFLRHAQQAQSRKENSSVKI